MSVKEKEKKEKSNSAYRTSGIPLNRPIFAFWDFLKEKRVRARGLELI